MADLKETAFNYIEGEHVMYFSTSSRTWITKMNALAKKFPDQCKIKNKNKCDGSISGTCPKKWFKITPGRVMSEKQKQAARKNLQKAREAINQD